MRTLVVHKRALPYPRPPECVYIGRGSAWGNPFHIGEDGTRDEVIAKYREWIMQQQELMTALHTLKGKTLYCYCKPKACHGDVLAELADASE